MTRRPNLVFIMSDDHAAHCDLRVRQSVINRTPNIDRIADGGHALRLVLLHELDLHAEPGVDPHRHVQPRERRDDARHAARQPPRHVPAAAARRRLPDGAVRQVAPRSRARRTTRPGSTLAGPARSGALPRPGDARPELDDDGRTRGRARRVRHRPHHRRLHRLARPARPGPAVRPAVPPQGAAPLVGARRAARHACTTTSTSPSRRRSGDDHDEPRRRGAGDAHAICSTSTRSIDLKATGAAGAERATRRSAGATSATSRTTCAWSRRSTTTSAGCSTTSTPTGLADDTIVIYTSDQGFFLGDHGWFDKRFMYEESLRDAVPGALPGLAASGVEPGSVCDDMVLNVDFAPTFLDLAGVDVPDDDAGPSFAPLLRGRDAGRLADVDVLPLLDAPRRLAPRAGALRRAHPHPQADLLLQRPARPARRATARSTRPSGSCSTSSPTRTRCTTSIADPAYADGGSRAARRARPAPGRRRRCSRCVRART